MAQPQPQVPQAPSQMPQAPHLQPLQPMTQMPQVPQQVSQMQQAHQGVQMGQRQAYSPPQLHAAPSQVSQQETTTMTPPPPPPPPPSTTTTTTTAAAAAAAAAPLPASQPATYGTVPPNKRPRVSPTLPTAPQQAQYVTAPFVSAPTTQGPVASPIAAASPSYINQHATPQATPTYIQKPQTYTAPYQNQNGVGISTVAANSAPVQAPTPTPTLTLPASPAPQSAPTSPPVTQQYTTAAIAPNAPPPPPTQGSMPPPARPTQPAKDAASIREPIKDIELEISDSLVSTGIDLRAEEQFLAELYSGSFSQDARTGLPANPPGPRTSFYGAGFANQPGESTELSQEAYEAQAAQRAWDEAAHRLAVVRSIELLSPFLNIANLHYRVDKIAKEHGIAVNLESKNASLGLGKLRSPTDFPQPKLTVTTKPGPDGAMVTTTGSWIPHDAYLADQLALLSIATKHRLRELIEDANNIAITRQKTSHGQIPKEWEDVSAPLRTGLDSLPDDMLVDGTADLNLKKRTYDAFAAAASSTSTTTKPLRGAKSLAEAVREAAKLDREIEEARLRKRQKRLNPESAQSGSRAGSAAPGTPGATGSTPEETKAPTKKEQKKASAARLAEANSTLSTNQTLSQLMGKRKKEYAWMTKAGSTPSTPRGGAGGADGGVGGGVGGKGGGLPEKAHHLTPDPRYPRLGTWREDKERGRNIQLRDWVHVLEMDRDRVEGRAVQEAYLKLDASGPKDRA